ncbi:tetratricopeptide repeat protein [Flavimaricola marinus]|uniref:Tetratricopeptide repeat protein n=1 Tax=Flavimaricola marinus TaxID=1819565 RepID=A0A238LIJ3_9RHOB|nr:tetratricopeptide repeat protein [Flavimaricola marinus]SMY08690.1 Tetratricopeptide repeat protein [Flavimaricola marinus]
MAFITHQIKCIVAALTASVWFSIPAAADQARVDDLLAQLSQAEGIQAERLVAELQNEWSKSGSAAMDLLLRRGQDALEAGEPVTAAEHFTAAIDHAPDFAEAYSRRAAAYYQSGLIGPALEDLRQALTLNPDNFVALRGFGVLLEELDRKEDALEVFLAVQEVYPADEDTAAAIARLEMMLQGQAL